MKSIVVGIDGSVGSRHALDRALRLGQLTGCEVRLMSMWTTPTQTSAALGAGYMLDIAAARDSEEAACRQLLDDELQLALGRRVSDLPVTVKATAHEGLAAPMLGHASRDALVVVVGTKGRGRMGNLLRSPLADLLHLTSCPVLVVPASTPSCSAYRHVVVGVDGSRPAAAALHWAHAMARLEQADMIAVHAAGTGEVPTRVEDVLAWRSGVLAQLMDQDDVTCDVRVIPGHPERVLASAASPEDLLVVGSHGAGAVTGLVLGSVSSSCIAHPGSSVLVVKEEHQALAAELHLALATAVDDG